SNLLEVPSQPEIEYILHLLLGSNLLEVPSQPGTPRSTPPSPATPQSIQELPPVASSPTVPIVEPPKSVVKPGVLRYTSPDEYPVGVGLFSGNKPQVQGTPISNAGPLSTARPTTGPLEQPIVQPEPPTQPQTFTNQLQSQVGLSSPQFTQPPSIIIPTQNASNTPGQPLSPHMPQSPKIAQFKVKPTSSLMPDEKKQQSLNQSCPKTPNFTKKKNRKSPAGSPHPPQSEQPVFGSEQSGREEVQSPAYSDISDDGAPVIETEMPDKNKPQDKKADPSQPLPHMAQYGMYHPFYGQHHQYLVPPAQENKPKEPEKQPEKVVEKEAKKEGNEYPSKVLQQHYYPYGYVPGYAYNMDSNYGGKTFDSFVSYHAPEDLSRAPPPTKALDMLQHHAQYYSSHKIHELQERAIKSPTPKTSMASSSPSTNNPVSGAGGGGGGGPPPPGPPSAQVQMNAPPTSQPGGVAPTSGKQTPGEGKESRSPPPQRHVHTHHHTHVGLGYPMYPAPYG
uniref:Leucine-rich repeat extensin-like protein 5 n=1 Tax=Diabrotica virgifera virgifera TaxID=50390 RepID=A0A6P7H7Z9_DIAVI